MDRWSIYNKMNNKRAVISGEVIMVIPRILFLVAILFAVIILIKILIITTIDIREVESSILVNRLLFSKEVIYYDKNIERLYPGIIDLEKFTELSNKEFNTLDTHALAYGPYDPTANPPIGPPDNPIIAAKITLIRKNVPDIVVYYNKERYDRWEPRLLPGVRGGAGSFKEFKDKKYVFVKDVSGLSPAILDFFIIS